MVIKGSLRRVCAGPFAPCQQIQRSILRHLLEAAGKPICPDTHVAPKQMDTTQPDGAHKLRRLCTPYHEEGSHVDPKGSK